ncbi:MAG: hypothetical protein EPO51_01775 [Phenylobacterium sp.]|uniref:hypothetical protein n=1 Tax=Phenylobacterium sp. TaxID=1871053 RepID=UPI00121BA820|nr:hypothetical protein [Phenylobacterium sp.]TAJ74813.1 MAG: hypothetical protein EPO51_01775 [Phenylobacterium sp.]
MFAAVLLAAAAAPAQAGAPTTVEPAVATAPARSPPKPRADEMVCKREPVLGSRMKERVCLTQADWEQRRADARADIEKAQTNNPIK